MKVIIYEFYDNLNKHREIGRVDKKLNVTGKASNFIKERIKKNRLTTLDDVIRYFSSQTFFGVKKL